MFLARQLMVVAEDIVKIERDKQWEALATYTAELKEQLQVLQAMCPSPSRQDPSKQIAFMTCSYLLQLGLWINNIIDYRRAAGTNEHIICNSYND